VTEQLQRTRARGAGLAKRAGLPLLLYVLVLAVVLFSPTSHVQTALVNDLVRVLQALLPDSWVTFTRVEVLMNAVIIAPVSFLGSRVWPRLRWQDWTAYAFVGASTVELIQGVLLPGRQASFSDIVANTIGALLGAVLYRRLR
jgi:glycopeptide antibiotics resistance protein